MVLGLLLLRTFSHRVDYMGHTGDNPTHRLRFSPAQKSTRLVSGLSTRPAAAPSTHVSQAIHDIGGRYNCRPASIKPVSKRRRRCRRHHMPSRLTRMIAETNSIMLRPILLTKASPNNGPHETGGRALGHPQYWRKVFGVWVFHKSC